MDAIGCRFLRQHGHSGDFFSGRFFRADCVRVKIKDHIRGFILQYVSDFFLGFRQIDAILAHLKTFVIIGLFRFVYGNDPMSRAPEFHGEQFSKTCICSKNNDFHLLHPPFHLYVHFTDR